MGSAILVRPYPARGGHLNAAFHGDRTTGTPALLCLLPKLCLPTTQAGSGAPLILPIPNIDFLPNF